MSEELPKQGVYVAPKPNKSGHPPKLSKVVHDRFLEAIDLGVSKLNACRYARINENTFYQWLKWGREGRQGYKEFLENYEHALARVEMIPVAHLRSHMPHSVHACVEFLARRFPETWGRRDPDLLPPQPQSQTNVLVIEVGEKMLAQNVLAKLPGPLAAFLQQESGNGAEHGNGTDP